MGIKHITEELRLFSVIQKASINNKPFLSPSCSCLRARKEGKRSIFAPQKYGGFNARKFIYNYSNKPTLISIYENQI